MVNSTSGTPEVARKRRVVVVGAGVAGMTAAHELVERGYEVEVVEAAADPYDSKRAVVGGMARTSWAAVPQPMNQYPLASAEPPAMEELGFDESPAPCLVACDCTQDFPLEVKTFLGAVPAPEPEKKKLPLSILTSKNLSKQELADLGSRLKALGFDHFQVTRLNVRGADSKTVMFRFAVQASRVPGEHGFRFFPSFYRHMFDTMKRIPVEEASIGVAAITGIQTSSDSARTVFDNLRSADEIELGLYGNRSYSIARHPIRSLQELRELMANALEKAGYRGEDLYRLLTRYLEYLTSSKERRRSQYETQTWSQFLELDSKHFSAYFRRHVNSGAQALVAMSSETNDARTIGSIAVQLTLDEIRANPSGYTDATLRDPTSMALLDPWRSYLESEGVVFTQGTFAGFTGKGMVVRPVFWKGNPKIGYLETDVAPADYYVLTLPIDRFQALFKHPLPTPGPRPDNQAPATLMSYQDVSAANKLCLEIDHLEGWLADIPVGERDDIAKYHDYPIGAPDEAPDKGPLRYMCGIQFFLDADVRLFLGHTVGLDTPWGVSYLSQEQYWQDRSRGQNGTRGVLSAIFTRWQVKAEGSDGAFKTALECTPKEIADRVWRQIVRMWDEPANGPLPTPSYYYLDPNVHQRDDGSWTNDTPYLVNEVGHWSKRGGARLETGEYRYPIQLGHTVFAGAFMRTCTRLNTMEAANESGRRAVNAILERDRSSCQRSEVFDLERFEVPELRPARELDARILRRGGRHALRSSATEGLLRAVPWDLVRIGLPTKGEQ